MRLPNLFKRASPENPANPISVIFQGGTRTKAGARMSEERAMALSAVWRAVNLVAGSVATMPLHVFRRDGDGRARVPDHPISRLLRTPNDALSGLTLRETLQAHALLWFGGFAAIDRNNAGLATALWPIHPRRVAVMQVQTGHRIEKWFIVTIENGERRRIAADDMLHVHGLSDDGLAGRSVIAAARESLGHAAALEEFGSRFFGRGANSSVAIRFPQGVRLPEEVVDQLRSQWSEIHEGLENAHRTVLLQDGAELEKLTIPNDDAQFLESRVFSVQEVARWFGVPPALLGELSHGTFSNTEQQGLSFDTSTLRVWLTKWEDEITRKLLPVGGPFFAEHVMDGLLRADSAARGDFYTKLAGIGAMTPNEIRQRENLPPIEGGDVPNLMPGSAPMNGGGPQPPEPPASDEGERASRSAPPLEFRAVQRRRDAARPLLEAAAGSITRREIDSVRKLIRQSGTPDALRAALEEHYAEESDFRAFVQRKLLPAVRAYASGVALEKGFSGDMDEWIEGYAARDAAEWAESSRGQLAALETPDELDERLGEWAEKRPGKYAARTVVAAETAAARHAWKSLGVERVVWVTQGGACPICDEMDGRTIAIEGTFVLPGDDIADGEGGTAYKSTTLLTGPPLHKGCVCTTEAA